MGLKIRKWDIGSYFELAAFVLFDCSVTCWKSWRCTNHCIVVGWVCGSYYGMSMKGLQTARYLVQESILHLI